jgi:hypothetical protein
MYPAFSAGTRGHPTVLRHLLFAAYIFAQHGVLGYLDQSYGDLVGPFVQCRFFSIAVFQSALLITTVSGFFHYTKPRVFMFKR